MELIYDEKDHEEQIYKMYQEIFQDPEPFAKYYFKEIYKHNQVLIAKNQGNLVGMIHLNPYRISIRQKVFSLKYIVAVAVDTNCRRQGIMAIMLKKILNDMSRENLPFTYLMPADKAYYEPFDFVFAMDWNECETSGKEGTILGEIIPIEDDTVISEYLYDFMKEYEVYTIPDQEYIQLTRKECVSANGEWMAWKMKGEIKGMFAVGYEDEDVFLRWAFSKEPEQMLLQIRNFYKGRMIEITGGNLMKGCQVPKIMCRITSLKAWEELLTCRKDISFNLRIVDPLIDENHQCFRFVSNNHKMKIEKTKEEGKTITIGELAQVFFGYGAKEILEEYPYLKQIEPIRPMYISEEV